MIHIDDFLKLDIRVGRIMEVQNFPEARKPAYKLTIDFGEEIGIKKSSVQITERYAQAKLVGKTILGVVNLPPRQIGKFVSEVLTLGVPDENGKVILVTPEQEAPLGSKLF